MSDPFNRPPIASVPISVVLVARNAADSLLDVLSTWKTILTELEREYEIILVDDGSTDATGKILDELPQNIPEVKVMRHAAPRGFGAALRTGIAEAQHPLLCYCTADNEYEPADFHKMLAQIDSVDVVNGCRQWRPIPFWFRIVQWLFRVVLRVVFGIPKEPLPTWLGIKGFRRRRLARWVFGVLLHDPECAYRLFRREILARVPIQSDGTFAHIEILAKANFLGGLLTEVLIAYHPEAANGTAQMAGERFSRHEIQAVFSHPDFGPVQIETQGYTCLSEEMLTPPEKQEENAQQTTEAADDVPNS